MASEQGFDPRVLDPGIRHAVVVLRDAGIETYESCEGGEGHAYPYPCVRFFGTDADGWRALATAITYALPLDELVRVWTIRSDQPEGPYWEMRFILPSAYNSRTAASHSSHHADSGAESVDHSDSPQKRDERQDRSGQSSVMDLYEPPSPPPRLADRPSQSSSAIRDGVKGVG